MTGPTPLQEPPVDGDRATTGDRPDHLVERARVAGQRLRLVAGEMASVSADRHAAVRDLRDRFGWSHQQVADALGVSRAQAQSIYEARSSARQPTVPAETPGT